MEGYIFEQDNPGRRTLTPMSPSTIVLALAINSAAFSAVTGSSTSAIRNIVRRAEYGERADADGDTDAGLEALGSGRIRISSARLAERGTQEKNLAHAPKIDGGHVPRVQPAQLTDNNEATKLSWRASRGAPDWSYARAARMACMRSLRFRCGMPERSCSEHVHVAGTRRVTCMVRSGCACLYRLLRGKWLFSDTAVLDMSRRGTVR